jgi:hypothetical protein
MEKQNEVTMAELAGEAERAGLNLAAIIALVSAAIKLLPQIIEIINQIKTVIPSPSPNSTPDGGFPSAK